MFSASKIECREGVRGLSPSLQPFYRPAKEFRCLDGSQIIPYDRVNDDYCDCVDSTDEPGTAACPNGSFYCTNAGYKPSIIPSSRVNDGICDCCDGSDEYSQRIACENHCLERGRQMREEALKQHQLLIEGHEVYEEYCQRGQQAVTEKQSRLVELEKEREELDVKRAELEKLKNEAEKPENEAKEVHKLQWEAEKEKRKEELKKIAAREAFNDLDKDQNGLVSVPEIRTRLEFDIDSNGEVSNDEAKVIFNQEYLEDNEEIAFEDFHAKVWDNINQIYRKPGTEKPETPEVKDEEAAAKPESPAAGEEDEERYYGDEGEENDDDDDEDKEDEEDRVKEDKKKEGGGGPEEEELPMPDYDESTKQLIAAADAARSEYNEADTKYRNADTEIGDIKKLLEFDLGPKKEFYPLKGQCFDFTDREYIYTLCPFERASQKSKHGGSETSLGSWGSWAGPTDFKYAVMKYERGQNCWSGPDRSATVHLQCGKTNELVSVSEPNRCEYRFVFNTPAICSQQPEPPKEHPTHEDL